MFKKIISIAVASVLTLSCASLALAKEPEKLVYNSKEDFSSNQGENCWYYQYTKDGTYTGYQNMDWVKKGSNTAWHGSNDKGYVENFMIKDSMMHLGGGKTKPARVWVAPFSGVVKVESIGNVRKTTIYKGSNVQTSVVKTNSAQKNEQVLWTKLIEEGDSIGLGNTYSFDVMVNVGDRIYFEAEGASVANAGIYWDTQVSYKQAVYFESAGKKISNASELASGAKLDCTFYDLKKIDEDTRLYLIAYDEQGRMRAMSNMTKIDVDDFADRKADVSITMPGSENGFSGWSVRLFGITDISGRYWPMEISEAISLN